MNTDTTFIIADNQDITRRGMHGYISDLFGECRTEDVANKQELVQTLTKYNECLVIFDYTLFDINGVEEFLIIEKRFPNVHWLLFSDELSEQFIRRLGIEKSVGMILKENSGEEIRSALKCMVCGERFLCHQITDLLIGNLGKAEQHPVLTATETEILKLIARGKSVKEIAAERTSSVHTIITHKKNIFRKLEVNNVYEATKYALRAGLVELVEYYI
ncbi:response regulator transcription factor [Parabacteroides massiliensis]|uniref:response regulator transcription factor n=1 Tax=Parabacteroides massiliensis TaxID=1750560 RepID=UPI00096A3718|nr:response regulator transcription factor [Parabacteroides massiliensis]